MIKIEKSQFHYFPEKKHRNIAKRYTKTTKSPFPWLFQIFHYQFEPGHEISNNVVCATSKASNQPAHTSSLIIAFASRLNILSVKLLTEHHLEFLSLKWGCTGWSESSQLKSSWPLSQDGPGSTQPGVFSEHSQLDILSKGRWTCYLINGNGCLELKETFHTLSSTDFRCLANKTNIVFLILN